MLSIIIPALNECRAIEFTVRQVFRCLDQAGIVPVEVIVVDDGSTDGTGRLAAEAGARVIRHPHRVGYGRSLKDGIIAASYDTVAITDADGTYPAQEIPDLFGLQQAGYDMVVGARTGPNYRQSWRKWLLRRILRGLCEWTAGRQIPDINSGLRVFSRSVALPHFNRLCDTFSFSTSLTLALMMNGRFVAYREIAYHERIGRSNVRLFADAVKTLQFITEAAVYYNPVKLFALLSFFCLTVAAVSLLAGLLIHAATCFMLGAGAILAAIIVFSLGLVCALLKQIADGQVAVELITDEGAQLIDGRRVQRARRAAEGEHDDSG